MRTENDLLGTIELQDTLYGVHTYRALQNFPSSGEWVFPSLVSAFLEVKLASASANFKLKLLSIKKYEMISAAVARLKKELQTSPDEVIHSHFPVNPYQGGAGTSLNMNVNEVITNMGLTLSGNLPGDYSVLHPLDDVNRSQSTNDTYPTALRIAAIRGIRELQTAYEKLQNALQLKETEWSGIIKLGRTQLQDAVPLSLGREFGAYAQAIARDRWRLYNAEERLRSINLGGTAIGTVAAGHPRFPALAVDELRKISALPLASAEDLVDCTQNLDVFVEVHGIIKAGAVSLAKIAGDLRLLSSGPYGGIGEIELPAVQAGSSIMPGKVNPVIPEFVLQIAEMVKGHDGMIANLCASGNLELNQFSPMIAHLFLKSADQLTKAITVLCEKCITGIIPDLFAIKEHLLRSTALATAFIPEFGYERISDLVKSYSRKEGSVNVYLQKNLGITEEQFYLTVERELGVKFE